MNLGGVSTPEELKLSFPNIVPKPRPLLLDRGSIDPNWLAGFTNGGRAGCFLFIYVNLLLVW